MKKNLIILIIIMAGITNIAIYSSFNDIEFKKSTLLPKKAYIVSENFETGNYLVVTDEPKVALTLTDDEGKEQNLELANNESIQINSDIVEVKVSQKVELLKRY
ncbi:MAG: hypothetical protein ACK5HR_02880 [Mycoplasmatales bacterium]